MKMRFALTIQLKYVIIIQTETWYAYENKIFIIQTDTSYSYKNIFLKKLICEIFNIILYFNNIYIIYMYI